VNPERLEWLSTDRPLAGRLHRIRGVRKAWEMIKELGKLDNAIISVLAEDSIAFDTPFLGRFGLSVLLELSAQGVEKTILYDTNSEAMPILRNLEIIGKRLEDVTAIFLSHCHYDHTDGLAGILEAMDRRVPVIAHPEIFRPCFELNPDGVRHIGIVGESRRTFEQKGAVFTFAKNPLNLMTGVTTTGEIERTTSFELLEDLYTVDRGEVVQDHERDDSAVVLNFEQGLVIVTGCCHTGIVNTMQHAKKITGVDKIHAVVGGLHFMDASEEKINKSVQALGEVDWIFAGHCTGFHGLRKIASTYGDRFARIQTGAMIRFPIEDGAAPIQTIPTAARDVQRFRSGEDR
jgi:7,8-dihydropterin-6-yl-methyl-4-(beta-D-ribofuranosyl)aminobenzene 5'-phosphate synthase